MRVIASPEEGIKEAVGAKEEKKNERSGRKGKTERGKRRGPKGATKEKE